MYIHTVLSFIFGIEHLPSQKALLLLSLDEHGTFLKGKHIFFFISTQKSNRNFPLKEFLFLMRNAGVADRLRMYFSAIFDHISKCIRKKIFSLRNSFLFF